MPPLTVQPLSVLDAVDNIPLAPKMKLETFPSAENVTLGRLLGTGKFNDVYEARIQDGEGDATSDDGRPLETADRPSSPSPPPSPRPSYVIKHLKDSLAEEDSEAFQVGAIDLAYEAEILSAIEHENIVKFHGIIPLSSTPSLLHPTPSPGPGGAAGSTAGKELPWMDLVLEKLQCTLYERVHGAWRAAERPYRRGALPLKAPAACRAKLHELLLGRLKTAADVARGLRHLHSLNIMHRDLKPDNIGFDASGTAKIFDFGLAKKVDPDDASARRHTGLVGTFRYMAPEVAKCRRYGLRADVYSFGLVLWEICALEKVYGDIGRRDFQDRIIYGDKRPGLSPSWSSPLRKLMALCWSGDEAARPSWDVIVDVLDAEMTVVVPRSETPPRRARPRFLRRSSMPMITQQNSSRSVMSTEESSAPNDAARAAASKKSRPKFCRRASATMIMQTPAPAADGRSEGSDDGSSRSSRIADLKEGRSRAMGDRPQFARQQSFPRRQSLI